MGDIINFHPPQFSPPIPAEDEWVQTHLKLLLSWQSFTLSHQWTLPITISRVNQFDAARLDIEMSAMLKEQLVKVFSLMKPGMLFQFEPELDAFLEFLIWRFSIWVDKPTPGIALMNLRYRDERAVEQRGKGKRAVLFLCYNYVDAADGKGLCDAGMLVNDDSQISWQTNRNFVLSMLSCKEWPVQLLPTNAKPTYLV